MAPAEKQPRMAAASGEAAKVLLEAEAPDAAALGALEELDLRSLGLGAVPASLRLCGRLLKLDLGGNAALKLPEEVASLPELQILFASGVDMQELPAALARCPKLRMLGARGNALARVDGACLPGQLEWLIMASNQIRELANMARLPRIRKLMLSHNRLTCAALAPVAEIEDLEMLRVASNCLEAFPKELLRHRRLAWVAVGGNPFAEAALRKRLEGAPPRCDFAEVTLGGVLGSGAGATVFKGAWRGSDVAVKLWDQEHFSDGTAQGEWSVNVVASSPGHPALVNVLGAFDAPKAGMILELLEGARAAAGPPSPASVTRDTAAEGAARLHAFGAAKVAERVALAAAYLHSRGLTHGDIYLHNTLVIAESEVDPRFGGRVGVRDARLSDFGAAAAAPDDAEGAMLQRLELRAFGWLLQDLLDLFLAAPAPEELELVARLRALRRRCGAEDVEQLPSFAEVAESLAGLAAAAPPPP